MTINDKKILFLSAIDFKDKSIQVIRKTPEAYRDSGFNVTYVVARDNVSDGNYFYEEEINPENLEIKRFYWSFPKLRGSIHNRWLKLLLTKIISFLVIIRLFHSALKLKPESYSVIYGYEYHGVLAMQLVKLKLLLTNQKHNIQFISRFQGTFLYEMIKERQYLRLIFNLDLILALWLPSQLFIMTDDGTQGDKALDLINPKQKRLFLVNGVDKPIINSHNIEKIKTKLNLSHSCITFISVSRLTSWKRVDRNIKILAALKKQKFYDFQYFCIGDGEQKEALQLLCEQLNLVNEVHFIGSIPNKDVASYLHITDIFLSMYESSNVGNPLLEAIMANKIIVTIDNGDTNSWIKHKFNGYIYDANKIDEPEYIAKLASELKELIESKDESHNIKLNLSNSSRQKLYTWQERFSKEVNIIKNGMTN